MGKLKKPVIVEDYGLYQQRRQLHIVFKPGYNLVAKQATKFHIALSHPQSTPRGRPSPQVSQMNFLVAQYTEHWPFAWLCLQRHLCR
jgi:hypothetical protein